MYLQNMIKMPDIQQSALDSFHAEIHGPVFLSVGPEAKLDMYNNFDLDKLFDLHLNPSSCEDPPLCRIIQEGKEPILTTDFYLTKWNPGLGSSLPLHQIRILPHQVAQHQLISLHQSQSQIQYNLEKSDFIPGCYIPHKSQFSTSGKKQ